MITLAGYLEDYFREIKPKTFLVTSIFLSLLIWLNYTVGLEKRMKEISPWLLSILSFYIFYLFVFGITWLFQPISKRSGSNSLQKIMPLFLVAPLLFSLKIIHWQIPSFITRSFEYPWNRYFAIVIELPLKLAMLLIALFFIHKFLCKDPYFFGLSPGNIKLQPYLLVLLLMIPFISIASVQGDFLNVYPKVRVIKFMDSFSRTSLIWKLIYEISYGLDFISVELFFR